MFGWMTAILGLLSVPLTVEIVRRKIGDSSKKITYKHMDLAAIVLAIAIFVCWMIDHFQQDHESTAIKHAVQEEILRSAELSRSLSNDKIRLNEQSDVIRLLNRKSESDATEIENLKEYTDIAKYSLDGSVINGLMKVASEITILLGD